MIIKIKYEKSNKIIDEIAKIDEPTLEKIFLCEVVQFETPNETQENINRWLSDKMKIDFSKKLQEADKEHTYKVIEISVVTKLKD